MPRCPTPARRRAHRPNASNTIHAPGPAGRRPAAADPVVAPTSTPTVSTARHCRSASGRKTHTRGTGASKRCITSADSGASGARRAPLASATHNMIARTTESAAGASSRKRSTALAVERVAAEQRGNAEDQQQRERGSPPDFVRPVDPVASGDAVRSPHVVEIPKCSALRSALEAPTPRGSRGARRDASTRRCRSRRRGAV